MWRHSLVFLLLLVPGLAHATIPGPAQSDPLYDLGYLKCDYYAGVASNDTGDSTNGLQSCIDDAYNSQLAAYLGVCNGVYRVSDTLRLYEFMPLNASSPWQNHVLRGSAECLPTRPIIKLINSSTGFTDATTPRPVVNYREFMALANPPAAQSNPSNPLGDPSGYRNSPGTMFTNVFEGIDIVLGTNAGAIGLTMAGGQQNYIMNTKMTATGGFAGIYSPPSMHSPNVNIEVVGGQYGILNGFNIVAGANLPLAPQQGMFFGGLKLTGQTVRAYKAVDVSPTSIVGFEIEKSSDGPAIETQSYMSLVDGKITMTSAAAGDIAIDNRNSAGVAQNFYARNVFVTGSSQLIRSGSTITSCTNCGTWAELLEYAALDTYQQDGSTDPTTYPTYSSTGFLRFEARSVICPPASDASSTCAVAQAANPISQVVNNAGTPPSDIRTRHVWTALPAVETATVNCATGVNCVVPSCTVYTGYDLRNVVGQSVDCTSALQSAITTAASAGHNNVHLKRGAHLMTGTVDLGADTHIIAAGPRKNVLAYKSTWAPTSEVYFLRSADSASGTASVGLFSIYTRNVPTANAWMSYLDWRTGKDSLLVGVHLDYQFTDSSCTTTGQPRKYVQFSSHGGGRVYGLHIDSPTYIDRNSGARFFSLNGNDQPTAFYGTNMELGKASCGRPIVNMEVQNNTAGVRVYGVKREGLSGTLLVNNSKNVGLFSSGAMVLNAFTSAGGYIRVTGTSDNVLAAPVIVQQNDQTGSPTSNVMLQEQITGETSIAVVPWPNGLIYKRGTLDDAPFTTSPPPAAPVLDTLTVDTPDRVDLCWTIFDNTAMLPSSSVTGVTVKVDAVTKTISSSTRTSNNCYAINLSAGSLTTNTQVVLVSYAPGNITAGGPGTPPATAFTDQPANNILTPTPQPAYTQQRFAWRSIYGLDDATSSPWYTSSPAVTTPNENAFFEAAPGTKMRVRVQVGVTTADAPQQTLTIYWELNGSGTWAPLTNSCASDPICFTDAPDLPDSYQAASRQLTSTHATYVPGGLFKSAGVQVPVTLTQNSESESEIAVQLSGSVAINDQVRLRMRTGTGTAFGSYPNVPTITVIRPRNTQAGGGLR